MFLSAILSVCLQFPTAKRFVCESECTCHHRNPLWRINYSDISVVYCRTHFWQLIWVRLSTPIFLHSLASRHIQTYTYLPILLSTDHPRWHPKASTQARDLIPNFALSVTHGEWAMNKVGLQSNQIENMNDWMNSTIAKATDVQHCQFL